MTSTNEIHPLFNPVILERLFLFLPIQSLKSCRLTCRLWSQATLPFLQKLSKVTLVRGGKAESDHFSFRNFLELISSNIAYAPPSEKDPPVIPFSNFYLDHWALNEKRERNLKLFWDICGHSMKHLHLSNVIFYEIETIRNILYFWSPNLESIKLENCLFYTITNDNEFDSKVKDELKTEDFDEPNLSYDYYDHVTVEQLKNVERIEEVSSFNTNLVEFSYDQLEDEEFPLAWEEIFHAFPNINKLNIACTTKASQITKILTALSTSREVMSATNFELNLCGSITESTKLELKDNHLYQISDIICLPLTSLSLTVNKEIKSESLINLIRQYSPVLQRLCLFSEEDQDGGGGQAENQPALEPLELFKYQKFPCLENLCVSMSILGGNFNWIDFMPQLKHLQVWANEEEFSWETPIDSVILKTSRSIPPTVKEIEGNKKSAYFDSQLEKLSIGYTLENAQSMHLLSNWFVNVRVLMMALTDDVIRVVFSEMRNLEEITVLDRFLTDAGITGNPRTLSEDTPWDPTSKREFPYIGDLKKLWKFTLTFRRYENITDLSVHQGFLDVPELSSVLLTRTKIGDTTLKILSMKPSLITMVTPTVCKGVELDYAD